MKTLIIGAIGLFAMAAAVAPNDVAAQGNAGAVFVKRDLSINAASGVRVLGETSDGGRYTGRANAPVCAGAGAPAGSKAVAISGVTTTAATGGLALSVPRGLVLQPIQPHAAAIDLSQPWTDMVAHLTSEPVAGGQPSTDARVYLEKDSELGFPVVLIPGGSTVSPIDECHFSASSGQDVKVARVRANVNGRGMKSYVLAYTPISVGILLSVSAETTDTSTTAVLMTLVRSITINPKGE